MICRQLSLLVVLALHVCICHPVEQDEGDGFELFDMSEAYKYVGKEDYLPHLIRAIGDEKYHDALDQGGHFKLVAARLAHGTAEDRKLIMKSLIKLAPHHRMRAEMRYYGMYGHIVDILSSGSLSERELAIQCLSHIAIEEQTSFMSMNLPAVVELMDVCDDEARQAALSTIHTVLSVKDIHSIVDYDRVLHPLARMIARGTHHHVKEIANDCLEHIFSNAAEKFFLLHTGIAETLVDMLDASMPTLDAYRLTAHLHALAKMPDSVEPLKEAGTFFALAELVKGIHASVGTLIRVNLPVVEQQFKVVLEALDIIEYIMNKDDTIVQVVVDCGLFRILEEYLRQTYPPDLVLQATKMLRMIALPAEHAKLFEKSNTIHRLTRFLRSLSPDDVSPLAGRVPSSAAYVVHARHDAECDKGTSCNPPHCNVGTHVANRV